MQILIDNLDNSTARRSLYCVWMAAREGEPAPLVARWIDPEAERRDVCRNDDPDNREEARGELWLGISLQFV